ncbi:MAG: mechanosensitive ion channel [Melioribacteraceae bacterium]|nr:MAG: mechanosensitive ion channel [Melioribacteraceae bacterium]
MQEIFDILKNWAEVYILKIIAAIAILVIGKIIAGMIKNFVKKLLNKSNMDLTIVSFLSNLLYGLLITLIVLVALGQLGVETTSFVAIVGAAGLAVGFALKDSLGNFASGVMLLINKPFSVGHYIEAGGTAGTVLEIKLFATKLKTPDNKVIYVPNASVVGGNITNFSAEDTRRVDMQFGIGYNDDIDKAKQIILKLLSNDDRVLKDPKPQVVVGSLGDSSVNIVVRPWVNKADYWGFFFDMTETVKKEFDNAGVSIPFPQRDVHLYQQSKN